jgi:cell division protein FtsL
MSSKEKKPRQKRVRFSAEIMFLLTAVFCTALSITYLVRYNNIATLEIRERELKKRIEELERDNRQLKASLETYSTPEGIERLARERLGLVKPEELVIYTVDDKNKARLSQD